MNKPFHLISRIAASLLVSLLFSNAAFADRSDVISAVNAALPQYEIETAELHESAGLYVVTLKGAPTLHVTQDGKYFVAGDLYRLDNDSLVNESELAKLKLIESTPESEMIVFKAPNESSHITVFTDVDCVYCRMLHKEVKKLNDAGVTVRYMAYPRSGIGSGSYRKMVSIWCSSDPKEWLTKGKLGSNIPDNKCVNPVADQFNLGNAVGVRGTPTIVSADGQILPGYLPAEELVEQLKL